MDKWKALKTYCQGKIDEAKKLCPSFDEPGRSQLRDECAYVMKHYHDVLLRMKDLEVTS